MAAIEIDPRVQALFDDNLARTRRANEEVNSAFKVEQARITAEVERIDEKFAKERAELKEKAAELLAAAQGERRKQQWDRGDKPSGELAFGVDDDPAPQHAVPPIAPAAPLPPSRQQSRRPVRRDEDDEDFGSQTWLT
jgi:hypothetical protein